MNEVWLVMNEYGECFDSNSFLEPNGRYYFTGYPTREAALHVARLHAGVKIVRMTRASEEEVPSEYYIQMRRRNWYLTSCGSWTTHFDSRAVYFSKAAADAAAALYGGMVCTL